MFVNSTAALGTTAPEGSATTPATTPVVDVCPIARVASSTTAKIVTANTVRTFRVFIESLLQIVWGI
jgi:hypothetical protein